MPRKDPRLKSIPTSVNEEIADREIRHLLYLTRLQTKEATELVNELDKALPKILDHIENVGKGVEGGVILSSETQRRLQTIAAEINQIIQEHNGQVQREALSRYTDIAEFEADFEQRLLTKSVPVAIEFDSPELSRLRSIVRDQPMNGKPISEWFSRLDQKTLDTVTTEMKQGMIEGESMFQIRKRIEGTVAANFTDGSWEQVRRSARALARTSVIHTSTLSKQALYEANEEHLKGISWIATLDLTTCLTCGDYDGNVYRINSGPRPTAHINCRCSISAVLKSWKELGFDFDEVPATARASMDGEVPGQVTYNQWLKKQSAEVQNEALGKTRALAFRKGKASVETFTDRRGRILNLDQIRAKEGDIFK